MLIVNALNLATQTETREERLRGTDALLAMCDDERSNPRRGCAAQVLLKAVMRLTLPPEVELAIKDMMNAATKDGADFTFLALPRHTKEWMEGALRLAAWGDGFGLVVVTGPQSVVEETLRRLGTGQLTAPVAPVAPVTEREA